MQPTMERLAPFLRSDGFICALEGLMLDDGAPLVYAHGLPHGKADEVAEQILFAHSRCLAQSLALEQPAASIHAPLTIVNVRAASFRFPDAGCLRALKLVSQQYPWAAGGRAIFVAAPGPVKWTFERLRPLLSAEQFEAIAFVDTFEDLAPMYLQRSSLPAFLGGTADWDMESYIARRCEEEGVANSGEVREYTGPRIDWAPLDRFDERQRQKKERRQKRQREKDTKAVVEEAEEGEVEEVAEAEEVVAAEDEVDTGAEATDVTEPTLIATRYDLVDAPVERRRWRDRLRGVVVSTREILSRSKV